MKLKLCIALFCFVALSAWGQHLSAATAPATTPDCGDQQPQLLSESGSCGTPSGLKVMPEIIGLPPSKAAPLTGKEGTAKKVTSGPTTGKQVQNSGSSVRKTVLYFFWGQGCPHCEDQKKFLDRIQPANRSLEIRSYEVWHNRENALLMAEMLQARGKQVSGVPITLIHDQVLVGFSGQTSAVLEQLLEKCRKELCIDPSTITGPAAPVNPVLPQDAGITEAAQDTRLTVPLFGDLDARQASLPFLTIVIAGMDSFNPCAFFVLLTLLGLLTHVQSRSKMLLIGGIFVFFSGLVYFLFMAAWLNLFLLMGHVGAITTAAGIVSLVIALINIKDFFLFKQGGVSLTIPDSAKPRLFDRMRRLMRSTSLVSVIVGTSVLALLANFYELLCTAGFPMVFTRILTLNNLSPSAYYLYLLLYNIVYVIPLFLIVLGFTYTLGKHQLSEWQGRVLKLVSGIMMLGLGVVLLIKPELMNNIAVSAGLLVGALVVSLILVALVKRIKPDNKI